MVASAVALVESSEELLRLYEQTGDERAFAQLVQMYRGMVFGVCLRVMRNTHDAEDATQAVFLTLSMQARGGNNIRMIGPWLQQVAQRVSLDMYKSRKRRQAREDVKRLQTSDRFDATESRQMDQDELRETLRTQLNELPAKYRMPMILYYFGGLTPEAIAKELGCKKKTLGVRLFRARKLLAEQLASRGVVACGAGLMVALQQVVHQGLYHSAPTTGLSYASGFGASAGLGLGMDHLSTSVVSLTRAMSRFAFGSKVRLVLLVMVAMSSAMAGSAGLIKRLELQNLKPFRFWTDDWKFDDIFPAVPKISVPDLHVNATQEIKQSATTTLPQTSYVMNSSPLTHATAWQIHTSDSHASVVVTQSPVATPALPTVAQASSAPRNQQTQYTTPLPSPVVRSPLVHAPVVVATSASHGSSEAMAVAKTAAATPFISPSAESLRTGQMEDVLALADAAHVSFDKIASNDSLELAYSQSVGSLVSVRASELAPYVDGIGESVGMFDGEFGVLPPDLSGTIASGNSIGAPVTPEPAALSILMLGTALFMRRRPRQYR